MFKKLVTTDELTFQRGIRPLLEVIDPAMQETPGRGSADRCGVDHLVWERDGVFPLIVQTKGFAVDAAQLGRDQIRQCRDSIRTFRDSGLVAERYILIHNRDGRSDAFRETVLAELEGLRANGSAHSVPLVESEQSHR